MIILEIFFFLFLILFRAGGLHNARNLFGFTATVNKRKLYKRKELVG